MKCWLPIATLLMLFGALAWIGCPAQDDDDSSDDDDATGDDDTGDDDTGDDDTGDDDTGDDDTGDDDTGDDDTGDDDTGDDDDDGFPVTATVTVPGGFDDVPVSLYVGYLESWDAQGTAGDGLEIDDPVIGDGTPLDIEGDQAGLVGEYIIVVVLYVEGGTPNGEGWPTEGVDYVYSVDGQELGVGPIDLGTIEVAPYYPPD